MAGGSAGRPSLPRISWPSPRRRLPESIERFPAGNPPPRVHPMLMLVLNVLFVLVAISMIALILMQRGSGARSEEHTSELQSLIRISYAVFCLKKKTIIFHFSLFFFFFFFLSSFLLPFFSFFIFFLFF